MTKTGYVTIIGLPNAGKSTLMNALLGERLSIITNKPQTTRKRILGILSDENHQIIFLDTPGILDPSYLLQEKMMKEVERSIDDADLLVAMIDLKTDPKGELFFQNDKIISKLNKLSSKKILLLNKIDLSDSKSIEQTALLIKEKKIFDRILGISALAKFNIDILLETIKEYLPEHPKYYPDDRLTDETERFFVSEIIREKILLLYKEEIPYSVEVIIEEFKERAKGKDFVQASIIVERNTQKRIIIGKNGEAIKKLGEVSRGAIDDFLQRSVYLDLRVKVKSGWRNDNRQLKKFGYQVGDE